jgi:glycerol-3-phosphate dehydrogenase subunit C
VAEINIQAKARMASSHGVPLRDQFLARPDLLGKVGSAGAPLANAILGWGSMRWLLERLVGITRHGPLPHFATPSLRSRLRRHVVDCPPDRDEGNAVVYFHGCSANYFEPALGELAVGLLEGLGYRVFLPRQGCCGLPLQSNGLFDAARRYGQYNISSLAPFARRGIPIVGTSTSCTLTLKHDYRAILAMEGEDVEVVAQDVFDIFEFLAHRHADRLRELARNRVNLRALYHPPCQLKSHWIGTPAWGLLKAIPGLELTLSESECCGIAGTYGMKSEKAAVALAVGKPLFAQARESGAQVILSDSETCRWWIARHTGLPALHPIEILARSLQHVEG